MVENLDETGLNFITKTRRNMKAIKRAAFEKLFLKKRAIAAAVIGQLKEVCQIEHSRHRKPDNFLINLLAALTTYCFKPRKLSINLKTLDKTALIPN